MHKVTQKGGAFGTTMPGRWFPNAWFKNTSLVAVARSASTGTAIDAFGGTNPLFR